MTNTADETEIKREYGIGWNWWGESGHETNTTNRYTRTCGHRHGTVKEALQCRGNMIRAAAEKSGEPEYIAAMYPYIQHRELFAFGPEGQHCGLSDEEIAEGQS